MKSINTLSNQIRKLAKNHESIKDIILFGSAMKGKDKPNDIDILIMFKEQADKEIETEIRNWLGSGYDVNSVAMKEFYSEGFVAKEGVYLEGYSLLTKQKLSEKMGFSSIAIIRYDIGKITGSNRVRFYYALWGRNNSGGFLKSINANRFTDNAIICEYSVVNKLIEFLDQWNVEKIIIPTLIPKRLKKILI